MKRHLSTAALAALAATALGTAYAATGTGNDALPVGAAKISLSQAVAAAEQHVGGKASRADYEKHQGQWIFDVEVVSGHKVTDVKVAADDGRILAATDDKADHDDDHDQAD